MSASKKDFQPADETRHIDPSLEMESDTCAEGELDFYLVPEQEGRERHVFARYLSSADGGWHDGIRPPHICETHEDVDAFLHGTQWWPFPTASPRPVIACGFCGLRKRLESKNTATAVRWLTGARDAGGHACEGEGVDITEWLNNEEKAA